MLAYFPKYFSERAIILYLAILLIVSVAFGHPMTWYWWVFGIVEVVAFFYYSNQLTRQWANLSVRNFEKKIFTVSLLLRIAFAIFSYFFYVNVANDFMGFGSADANTYHIFACKGADMIREGHFNFREEFNAMGYFSRGVDIGDMGFPIYQSFLYLISGKSMVFSRCLNALFSAWTVVLAYRLAKRCFGENVARMTAIFCVLMPNFILYCGIQLKETVMLFLSMLFVERADAAIRSPRLDVKQLLVVLAIGGLTFFFRAVLCFVLLIAFFFALVFSSSRVASKGKRLATIVFSVLLIALTFGNTILESLQVGDYQNVQAQQEQNMQWRAERENGNSLAKYAGAAVFAPLIFTIPFPTMVDIPNQETQQMFHGCNYVKNITSFFTIFALIVLLLTGKWKDTALPIAYMLGYLVVLVFSNFAQSERFHLPILPISLMCAAYGISLMTNKHKRWFTYWMVFIFVANVGWAWFKLRGRGM